MDSALDVPPTPFAIRLLGPFQIIVDGNILPAGRSRKEQWLLALMVLRQNRAVERTWLASTLWPDSQRARVQLRDTLYDLRKSLGSQAERLYSPTAQTLQLNISNADVDLINFDAAIASGEMASLQQATRLYRGALLEGCNEEWVYPERVAREHAFLNALENAADYSLAAGEIGPAIGHLQQLIAADPLRETAYCRLMEALAASGNYAESSQLYREFRLRLRQEFQIEPSAETTQLYLRLRVQARRSRLSVPAQSPGLTISPGTQAGTQPLASNSANPAVARRSPALNSVPIPLSRLIGRGIERTEIHTKLGSTRLLSLIGSGGIGKTRLALAICEERAQHYPDGIWFVELAGLSDASLVTQAVASALGGLDSSAVPPLNAITTFLTSRHALLVLDNCEHLLQACATLASHLLKHCPSLQIMATSRQALGLTGEAAWRVMPLPLPAAPELASNTNDRLARILAYEAVQLFVERATEADSGFIVTPHNLDTIVKVCRSLDGVPLAIELAAARVNAMPVEQIETRLSQRFRLLVGGSRTSQPRQQTLYALIEWSYELLDDLQKRLFERLSVFAGGWTLEMAERICSGDGIDAWRVLDLLTSLVDKSLVVSEQMQGHARYRFLETMREYSYQQLQANNAHNLYWQRHLSSFLELAEEAGPHLKSAQQAEWHALMEAEHDNLRAALRYSLQGGGTGCESLRLCTALWRFWITRGHLSEGQDWCKRALNHSEPETNETARERGNVASAAGNLALKQGEFAAAKTYFTESLRIRKMLGDRLGIATTYNNLGMIADTLGESATAIELIEESLAIHKQIGNQSGIAWTLRTLGGMSQNQGNNAIASAYLNECLLIFQDIGERNGIAAALSSLGTIALTSADYDTAHAHYLECLAIYRDLGELSGIVHCDLHLATITAIQGDFAAADTYSKECLTLLIESNNPRLMVYMLKFCASNAYRLQQLETAAILWGAEQALWKAITLGEASHLPQAHIRALASCRTALGDAAFETAYSKGTTIPLKEAVQLGVRIPAQASAAR